MTRAERLDASDPDAVARAATILEAGGLVALPTETVYGLGARADDEAALRRIFAAKGRPATNPLIAHVRDAAHARSLTAPGAWTPRAQQLAEAFWPGPLTLVLPRSTAVPDALTAGGPTVALRVPGHPVFRQVLARVPFAVAAPSANPSERISPTTADHVAAGLGDRIDAILDAGACPLGLESTVVALPDGDAPPRVLRPGALALSDLRRILPDVVIPLPGEAGGRGGHGGAAESPGTSARHYAPHARILLGRDDVSDGEEPAPGGAPVWRLVRSGSGLRPRPGIQDVVLPADAAGFGAGLYDTLHAADAAGVALILVPNLPETEAWLAVRDRLARAAR